MSRDMSPSGVETSRTQNGRELPASDESLPNDIGPITLEPELHTGLDRFIADRNEPPRGTMSHADAVNVIVRDWLMGQGYIDLPEDPNRIVPALEAAHVPK